MRKDPNQYRLGACGRAMALASVSLIALGAGTLTASAQVLNTSTTPTANSGQLREVVITAERRRSTVQKTAASISVRNGDDMIRQGRLTLQDYLQDVPGVSGTVAAGGFNPNAALVIRGVIPDNTGDGTQIPTTAVYADGVYSGLGGNYDIDRVEVLRGPQGTLYGRSATGGVVASYSRDPVLGKFAATITGTYGNYDQRNLQLGVNIPITSEIAARVSGQETDQHGYLSARGGSTEQTDGRIKLLYQPWAGLSVLLGVATEEDHNHIGGTAGYQEYTPGGPLIPSGTVAPITPNEDHEHQFWANANWDMGWATATYIPSFRRAYYMPELLAPPGPPGMPFGINPTDTSMDQYITQEARLTSDPGSPLTWITGVFYYNQKYKNDTFLQWNDGAIAFNSSQDKLTQDVGVFGESTYPIDSTLRVTAGLRYDWTYIDHTELYENNLTRCQNCVSGPPNPGNPNFGLPEDLQLLLLTPAEGTRTFNNVTYKVRLEKDLTPVNSVYATASSGFLPADVQVSSLANGQPYPSVYSEETLNAFEVGSKNRFLDNTLQLNASVYYYLYSGYQQDAQPQPSIPGSLHEIITAAARMYGGDLEITYRLTPADTFHLALGGISARFTTNPLVTAASPGFSAVYFSTLVAQRNITDISPFTLSPSYEHTFDLPDGSSINAHADAQLNAGYDASAVNPLSFAGTNSNTAQGLAFSHVPTEVLGNLALTWFSANSKYSVGGFVRNVGNTIYTSGAAFQPQTNNGPGLPGGYFGTPTQGRRYGVTAHLSY